MSRATDPSLASLGHWLLEFATCLLLPLLGVLALTRKRLAPFLWALVVLWVAAGVAIRALGTPHMLLGSGGQREFWTRYAIGLFLAVATALVAHMHDTKRTRRWIKLGLVVVTIAAFASALWSFLQRYG